MLYLINIFFIFFLGCSLENSVTHFKGQAMTMSYHITINSKLSNLQKKEINQVILNNFKQTDFIFNNWNPSSEISQINQNKSCDQINLSLQLSELLHHSEKCNEITKQRFDPTIGAIFNTWKKALKKNQYPNKLELDAVGWDKIKLNHFTLQKKHPKCQLDLCGISKGYTIDLLAEKLINLGYQNFLIEWGGEIFAKGMNSKKRKWSILIQNLVQGTNKKIFLQNQAIATSGSFMLDNWNIANKSYYHIFDPKLKRPLEKSIISTVSVIAPHCYLADAIATAAMTFKDLHKLKDWARELVQNYPEVSFIIVNSKNQLIERISNERCDFF